MIRSGSSGHARKRLRHLLLVLLTMAGILFGRLSWLQVVEHEPYSALARAQQEGEIEVEALRGSILDRNRQALATSMARSSVALNPLEVPEREAGRVCRELARALSSDPGRIATLLERGGTFAWVQRKVPDEAAERVRALALPGVFLLKERSGRRFYPKGRLASHLLGATGIDDQGLDGIEAAQEAVLAGKPGLVKARLDRDGWRMPMTSTLTVPVRPGRDLQLTLDETIQYVAERELAAQVKQFNATGGICLVMDARSAEILALAIQPDFPAEKFTDVPAEVRRNRAITDPYEPGSTFKIFLAAAALEAGLRPGDLFPSAGPITVDGWPIHNADDGLGASAMESLTDIIAFSFNVGTASIAERIGPRRLHESLRAFGFGEETGLGLQGEEPGLLSHHKDWARINTATISFGQGVAVTPIQLVSALQAVANGGVRLQPRILKAVLGEGGEVLERFESRVLSRPMTPANARDLAGILAAVVERGTGKKARIPGHRVAGKTGTAQVVHNGAYGDDYIASFLGFAPVEDPRVVILVKIEAPKPIYWGGFVAGPVFSRVAGPALWKLGVRPDPRVVVPEGTEDEGG